MKPLSLIIALLLTSFYLLNTQEIQAQTSLNITNETDNRADYPNSLIPNYKKFEITFDIQNSVAGNYQFPYDPAPPNGIDLTYPKYNGISVDAYFLPPDETDWNKSYAQPAFYYKEYDYQLKDYKGSPSDWYYPTGQYFWKVRFSPNQPGTWQYKLKAIDASGSTETSPISFDVTGSDSKGFLKVSPADPRYFEFDNGTTFFQHGLQSQLRGDEPITDNQSRLQMLGSNNTTLIRTWSSGTYGTAWPEWIYGRNIYDGYLPRPGVLPFRNEVDGRETMTVHIDYELDGNTGWFDSCMFQFWDDPHAIKRNTDYRILVKYRGKNISGPRDTNFPNYGLVVKTGGGWNYGCYDPSIGTVLTNYGHNNDDWGYVEGIWNSGESDWLPTLDLTLENVIEGDTYIDSISVREDLGNGQYGPEIINDSSFEFELYYPQPQLWGLDNSIRLAEENGVYIKMVIGDKSDKMWWKIDDDGTYVIDGESDNQTGYYGNWYRQNKTRWLHQSWWRQLQARYGYSTTIHSWEFTNEGDPGNGKHWSVTDRLGRYMKCEVFGVPVPDTNGDGMAIEGDKCVYDHPNAHLVTTSFWHSFPSSTFWVNTDFPNVDYADFHAYISTGWMKKPEHETDTALFHIDYSQYTRSAMDWYAGSEGIATKPIVRGEIGMNSLNGGGFLTDIKQDQNGVFLHNFIWASLYYGSVAELYWQLSNELDQGLGPDGQPGLFEIYRYFYDFIHNIPLSNGNYIAATDVDANMYSNDGNDYCLKNDGSHHYNCKTISPNLSWTDPKLRVVGQLDPVNNRAHLWVQNQNHTWRNVVDGVAQTGLTGTVTLSGFSANTTLHVEWHEFTTVGTPNVVNSNDTTDVNGDLTLTLPTNSSLADVGIKIGDYDSTTPPLSPTQTAVPGDQDGDNDVDIYDYFLLITNFSTKNIFDFNTLLQNL